MMREGRGGNLEPSYVTLCSRSLYVDRKGQAGVVGIKGST